VADQSGRDAGLQPLQLGVDGLEGDRQRLGPCLVGGVEGGSDAADDGAHHFHQGGEEQFLGVLFVGGGGEELVERLGCEAVFEGGAEHDADGSGGGETFEDGVEEHLGHLPV
jgi:hypothetical protein